ncbi:hypothetical protein AAV94_06430 [Lampropedia cohaerens]|uniref:Cadherin domain-containing protein n=1 Tax=Lampropedia cohaerens TaxID=1610491 RepID=A0A0U1Q016_9BURK|nr:hypothetical protein AAV94_06430 [Lampropedia cohaerens]
MLGLIGAGAAVASGGGGDRNSAPLAPDYRHVIEEDTFVSGRVVGSDADGDALTYRKGSDPAHGTLVVNPDGSYTYTPDPDYNGPDSFTVIADDGNGGTATSTVTIDVTPVNDAPEAVGTLDDLNGEDAQSGISVDVSSGFRDVDGDALRYTATGLPPGLSIDPETGVISGTIDNSASVDGPYAVVVTATDPSGESATQTFEWVVTNPAPVGADDAISGLEDSVITGNVLTNDTDPDGDTMTVTQFVVGGTTYTVPAGGSATASLAEGVLEMGSDGGYTFTPAVNWNGTVPTVSYTVSDGEGGSDSANLVITVTPDAPPSIVSNDANGGTDSPSDPLIEQGDITVHEKGLKDTSGTHSATGTLTLTAGDGVESVTIGNRLISLAELENASTTPVDIFTPNGKLTITGYTPNGTDFNGVSTGGTINYTYTLTSAPQNTAANPDNLIEEVAIAIKDAGGSTVSGGPIQINIIDDVPVATNLNGGTLTEDDVETTLNGNVATATGNSFGADDQASSNYVSWGTVVAKKGSSAVDLSDYGVLSQNADGSWSFVLDNSKAATQALTATDTITVTLPYTLTDKDGDPATANVSFTIKGADDAASVVVPSNNVNVYESGLDSGGSEAATDKETATGSFNVTASDGVASVTIGTQTHTQTYALADWLNKTIETDKGVFTIKDVTPASDGKSASFTYSYTLSEKQKHPVGDGNNTLTDSVTVKVDGIGGSSNSADLTVTIVDDVPVTANDAGNVTEGATLNVTAAEGVLKNDLSGADGWASGGGVVGAVKGSGGTTNENLTSGQVVVTGDYGILTLNADGSYTYKSTANAITADAQDVFTYTVKDGDGDLKTATLTINVANVAGQGLSLTGSVDEAGLPAGTDPGNGHTITAELTGLSAGWVPTGTLSGNTTNGAWSVFEEAGTWKYRFTLTSPTKDVDGVDETNTFSFETVDDNGNKVTNTVTITIIDDEPEITVTADASNIGALTVKDAETIGSATSTAEANFAGAFTRTIDYGADGVGTEPRWTYGLVVEDTASGLKSGGVNIELSLESNGQVVGKAGTATVFTLSVDGDGKVTLVQSLPIDHPTTDPSETLQLPTGKVFLSGTASMTDGDGDQASDTKTIDLGSKIVFTDAGPSIDSPADAEVEEKNLSNGTDPDSDALTKTGSLAINFGADGAGDVRFTEGGSGTETTIGKLLAKELTSGGTALQYALSDNGHTLTAYKGTGRADADKVFTVSITNPSAANAGYRFTLHKALDNPQGADLTPDFLFRVVDRDGDWTESDFTVTVKDDSPSTTLTKEVNEDSSVSFYTSADGTNANIKINGDDGTTAPAYGTVSVDSNGQITYTPKPNYSGADSFTYKTVADDGSEVTTTVNITVHPVADAPDMDGDGASTGGNVTLTAVSVNEDEIVSLGLKAPRVTDAIDQNDASSTAGGSNLPGDAPERLGLITLKLTGDSVNGAKLTAAVDGTSPAVDLTYGADPIKIWLSDVDRPIDLDTTGAVSMTKAQFEALQLQAPANSHYNITVTATATSYEVDDDGKIAVVDGVAVPPATATATVVVDVRAVTDKPTLTLEAPADATTIGAVTLTVTDAVSGGANAKITAAINEDATLNLRQVLKEAFVDADGSEQFWYTISGLPQGTEVHINGNSYTADASGKVEMPTVRYMTVNAPDLNPAFTIKPPANYSNSAPINATITLHVKDRDSDSTAANPATESVSVDLELRVYAIPDDVNLPNPAATPEDSTVAFLAGLSLKDTDGSESITQIRIPSLPTEGGTWVLRDHDGNSISIPEGGRTFIIGDGSAETYTLDQVRAFTLQPPAHSSLDGNLKVVVTTTETAADTQSGSALSADFEHDIKITVTPVAEKIGDIPGDGDTDGDGTADLAMHGNETYAGIAGKEDEWFALGTRYDDAANTSGGKNLADGWSNEDADEFIFAALTPKFADRYQPPHGDTLDGSLFRYHNGNDWITQEYKGTAVWVPYMYLDTLQFKPAPDVSGEFEIEMQAVTVDYDDDSPDQNDPNIPAQWPNEPTVPIANNPAAGVSVEVSGMSKLTGIVIDGVPDETTMHVRGKVHGKEDESIPLSITATSSDPSETVTVVIKDIPVGATIHYGNGKTFEAESGKTTLTIEDFNGLINAENKGPVSITPPSQWSGTFDLEIEAKSVDGGVVATDPKDIAIRTVTVDVVAVADEVTFDVYPVSTDDNQTPNVVIPENYLDANPGVAFSQLVDVASIKTDDTANPDGNDGSEVLSLRVTGLGEGFALVGGTLISGDATGTDRIWSLSSSQWGTAKILTPAHFSGEVTFQVSGVSTEQGDLGGDSKTWPSQDVSFKVSPSVDATATTNNSELVEDVRSALGLQIQHHGDTDERLGTVWIRADQISVTGKYTLYLNDETLDSLPKETIDGVEYVRIEENQVADLQVQGYENLSGDLGKFNFLYQVIDDHFGQQDVSSVVGADIQRKAGEFSLRAAAVTDDIALEIGAINPENAQGVTNDNGVVTVSEFDQSFTVNLQVDSQDQDGSEHVVRVIIEGVPAGVIVEGAERIGSESWLLIRDDAIGESGAGIPVKFLVSGDAHGVEQQITMKVQVKDYGDLDNVPYELNDPDRKEKQVTWTLKTTFDEPSGYLPASIEEWSYNGESISEDAPFTLDHIIDAQVEIVTPDQPNTFTVTLTDLPEGAVVTGMTLTNVDGKPTWSRVVTVAAGTDSAAANAALENVLKGITITPPPNSNDNNAPGGLNFNATLSASAGGTSASETIPKTELVVPVTPVTDPAVVTVAAGEIDENPTAGATIPVTITVTNPADGEHATLVDDILYVKVNASGDNAGGTLTLVGSSDPLTLIETGPHAGYYAVSPVSVGSPIELEYTLPNGAHPGSVSFEAYVETVEANAPDSTPIKGTGNGTATIEVVNNGVTVDPALPVAGSELATGYEPDSRALVNAIELPAFGTALVDNDGSEAINAVMLAGVPEGFLVYVNGTLALNAGGAGGLNTWVLADGPLESTDKVAILPPTYWSGEVTGLKLLVESGESSLSDKRTDSFELGELVVNPVANGLRIAPTPSLGTEGQIIALNLNAAMDDPAQVSAGVEDASQETTTVQLTGLGKHASFYVGSTLVEASYDADTDTYTIAGLTQDQLGDLGFKQAKSALVDQDGNANGIQIGVEAWTVESGAPTAQSAHVSDTITLNISNQVATSGNDTLLWTGEAIDGGAGTDVVQLRYGESLTGDELAAKLDNIEVLDLSVDGENSITDLTPEQVKAILGDSSDTTLVIQGTDEDEVTLAGGWTAEGSTSDGYIVYAATIESTEYLLHVHSDIKNADDLLQP